MTVDGSGAADGERHAYEGEQHAYDGEQHAYDGERYAYDSDGDGAAPRMRQAPRYLGVRRSTKLATPSFASAVVMLIS